MKVEQPLPDQIGDREKIINTSCTSLNFTFPKLVTFVVLKV